jgi:hypothetical protein
VLEFYKQNICPNILNTDEDSAKYDCEEPHCYDYDKLLVEINDARV